MQQRHPSPAQAEEADMIVLAMRDQLQTCVALLCRFARLFCAAAAKALPTGLRAGWRTAWTASKRVRGT